MSADVNRDWDELLIAEYALGVLPHGERAAIADRLTREPELRGILARWEAHLAPLAEAIEPATPPAAGLAAVETRLFGAPPPQPRPSLWSSLALWRSIAVAALAGVAVLGILYASLLREAETPMPRYVAQLSGEADAVSLLTLYDPRSSVLSVNRTAGNPAEGRSFELWLIEGGNAPVSLGVLPDSPVGSIAISPEFRHRFDDAVLAISDEPAGGSPTGTATGPVLATGKVSRF